MVRYRSRSLSPRRRSRSPRSRGRKRNDDEPRRSYGDRRSPAPSGLLVRNLPLDARPEDLRVPFERYGPVKDVYLPKNYYTGEPRGFGFVKFRYAEDAAEAKQRLNHTLIGGREIKIVFAEENRKTPQEMRTTSRVSGRHGGSYRRTPPRSPRRRYHSYSRSPSPRRTSRDHRSRDHYHSPRQSKSISRSLSPRVERDYRSNERSPTPRENGGSPHAGRDYEPRQSRSPRGNSRSPSRSRSQSYSPR
ncbi:Serine/arginine-rich SC35-like splicing factor [Melia azedarach]|uniref:Serine/arginine-rich SC35-like splicing factor n=1 Tax=Melia azedarach TaxID=155640 RepID=A0ACC1YER4_MELAZ|nr:Serine/arginine-rich SC35-like splicing factor [Melia azedarach]